MTWQAIPLGPPANVELRHRGLEHHGGSFLDRPTGHPAPLALAPGHRPILDAIEDLLPGEAVRINVDHDPEPLLELIETSAPAMYGWEPPLEGPQRWVGSLRRRSQGPGPTVRRLSSRLAWRAAAIRAGNRLEREVRAIALNLAGAADHAEPTPETARWRSPAIDTAVGAVRDGSLSVLIGTLERLLRSAPPPVAAELEGTCNREGACNRGEEEEEVV